MALTNYMAPVESVVLRKPGKEAVVPGEDFLDFGAWSRSNDYPILESVSVELKNRSANVIQVTLSPTYEQYLELTENYREFFGLNTFVEVKLGYSLGSAGYTHYTADTHTVTTDLSEDFISLEIEARGKPHKASKVQGFWNKPDKTVFEVLKTIADERGYVIATMDEDFNVTRHDKGGRPDPGKYGNLDRNVGYPVTGTVYRILQQLIEVVASYHFTVSGNLILITNQPLANSQREVPVLSFKQPFDVNQGIYPVISFSNSSSENDYARETHSMSSSDYDADEKGDPKNHVVKSGDDAVNQVSHRKSGVPDQTVDSNDPNVDVHRKTYGPVRSGRNASISERDPNIENKLGYAKRYGEAKGGISAEIETMGLPIFLPHQMIDVRGCGPIYDGKYEILNVSHSGGSDGYMTTLSVFAKGQSNESINKTLAQQPGETAPQATTSKQQEEDSETKTPRQTQ